MGGTGEGREVHMAEGVCNANRSSLHKRLLRK